jgi:hypothetical protein
MSSNAIIPSRSAPVVTPIIIYLNTKNYFKQTKNNFYCLLFTSVVRVKIADNETSTRCHEHSVALIKHD